MSQFIKNGSNVLLLLCLSTLSVSVQAAPDYERERRWSDDIIPGLVIGEPVHLNQENGHRFLTIYSETENTDIGIIVVHGMGLHPDYGLINILRQSLYDSEFTTLSIQMPILASTASYKEYPALFPDAVERLSLSVAFLKKNGYKKIVIVSHSNGSRMSREYMIQDNTDVDAWVALSLTQGDHFKDVSAPVLDIYAENDLTHVLDSSQIRQESMTHSASQQFSIADADHFFLNKENDVLKHILNFLDQNFPRIPKLSVGPFPGCFED